MARRLCGSILSTKSIAVFTLIELLVVVAIIAILASLLLPTLSKAQQMAKQTTCLSFQKQIGDALMMYVHDYNEYIPPGHYGSSTLASNMYDNWFTRLYEYTGAPRGYKENGNKYGDQKVYLCTSSNTAVMAGYFLRNDGVTDIGITSYMFNFNIYDDIGNWRLPGRKISRYSRPANTLYIIDGYKWGGYVISSSGYWEKVYYHNSRVANTLYLDGHAAGITQITADLFNP